MNANQEISLTGKVFSIVAIAEALTWLGLLIGMYLKYVSGTTEMGVWLFGRLHGIAFMVYLVVAIVAGFKLRWPLWALLVAILAAIPPLTTVAVEWWFRRKGLLGVR